VKGIIGKLTKLVISLYKFYFRFMKFTAYF